MNSLSKKERTCHVACQPLILPAVADKPVLLDFDGGRLSSDAGLLLLQQVDEQIGLSRALASVLSDPRDGRYTKHSLEDLLNGGTLVAGSIDEEEFIKQTFCRNSLGPLPH